MEHFVATTFSQYAYVPWMVYGAICAFMILSAFGLPLPEELVLVSAGFVGYMAEHPGQYPPPYPGAPHVNVYTLATVAFCAVMGSDFLIYALGRKFGPKLFKLKWFARLVSDAAIARIQNWTSQYGQWAVIIFRFTPGVRFPGHLMCGAMGLPLAQFLTVDTIAAGLSVPTQVILVSRYGYYILHHFTRFKIYLFSALAIGILIYIAVKLLRRRAQKEPPPPEFRHS